MLAVAALLLAGGVGVARSRDGHESVPAPVEVTIPTVLGMPSTPAAAGALPGCPAEALQIDVVPTKATFGRGETARGVGFVQTRAARGCLAPTPAFFRIEDVATGKVLATVPATSESPSPIEAEPGKMYTSNFSWDQKDCSGTVCAQAPVGLYQAVIVWTWDGPYRGWGEFRIAA